MAYPIPGSSSSSSSSSSTSSRWKGKQRAVEFEADAEEAARAGSVDMRELVNQSVAALERKARSGDRRRRSSRRSGRRWTDESADWSRRGELGEGGSSAGERGVGGQGAGGGTWSRYWQEPDRRDEGDGGRGGIVLDLNMVGSGIYDVAYVVDIKFGHNDQQFQLQVDTGSSDLWVASAGCSTSSCSQTGGRLYNPGVSSVSTGHDFSIPYLVGKAAGPIVWDRVSVGGYTIENQAFAAANDVTDEPLSPSFIGILGLALPLNSIIADSIPPVTDNTPDGAAWASNLFSITPIENSPAARFLSLSLQRPGSDRVPSLLGIGRHPSALVPDPSMIKYTTLVSERIGTLFWKVTVRAISVYVDGVVKEVDVGRSNTGAVFPSAVVDSGVPLILTTSRIANAIYGALGVGPGSDGIYYVPCTTPLNLTITIDTLAPIPIHPLDLTSEPPNDNRAQFCIGLIQAADAQLSRPDSSIGDMILGVPFMRNVYSVMAYEVPNTDGSFGPVNGTGTDTTGTGTGGTGTGTTGTGTTGTGTGTAGAGTVTNGGMIRPRIGFLSLTDPTIALNEFHTVRVLNQPIPPSNSSSSSTGNSGGDVFGGGGGGGKTLNVGGKKVGVGIVVLIGLMSFFALCGVLFVGRWMIMRRRFAKGGSKSVSGAGWFGRHRGNGTDGDSNGDGDEGEVDGVLDKKSAYRLARRTSAINGRNWSGRLDGGGISEDELREMRYSAFLEKERERTMGGGGSESTMASARTRVGDEGFDEILKEGAMMDTVGVGLRSKMGRGRSRGGVSPMDEFGVRQSWRDEVRDVEDVDEAWDPRTALSWPKEVKNTKKSTATSRSRDWGDVTLVGRGRTMDGKGTGVNDSLVKNRDRSSRSPPEHDVDVGDADARAWGDEGNVDRETSVHKAKESVDKPLLQHVSVPSGDSIDMTTTGMRGSISSPAALHIPFANSSSSSRTTTPTQSQSRTPFTHAPHDSTSSWVSQTDMRLKSSISTPTPPLVPISSTPLIDEFGVPSTSPPKSGDSIMAGVGRSRTMGMPLFVQPRPSISSQSESMQDGVRDSFASGSSTGSGAGMAMTGFAISSDESASTGVGVYATPPAPLGNGIGGVISGGW